LRFLKQGSGHSDSAVCVQLINPADHRSECHEYDRSR
jgi:hypothetical protein